jgi:hypothetical protein
VLIVTVTGTRSDARDIGGSDCVEVHSKRGTNEDGGFLCFTSCALRMNVLVGVNGDLNCYDFYYWIGAEGHFGNWISHGK